MTTHEERYARHEARLKQLEQLALTCRNTPFKLVSFTDADHDALSYAIAGLRTLKPGTELIASDELALLRSLQQTVDRVLSDMECIASSCRCFTRAAMKDEVRCDCNSCHNWHRLRQDFNKLEAAHAKVKP